MNKKMWIGLLFFLAFSSLLSPQEVRKAVWAGQFYEAQPEKLSAHIEHLLKEAEKKEAEARGIIALISPHAGYIYSGLVAAHAYRLARGSGFETAVIIGPSHHHGFRGCSIYPKGGYETPLGVAEVDEALALALARESGFGFIPEAHQKEHSVEVQIPFLQKTIPKAKIVPVVMGFQTKETILSLARGLKKALEGKNALVIASTDLSHFLPKNKANEIDQNTARLIQEFKTDTLIRKLERGEGIMCGGGPVVATLKYAQDRGPAEVKILKYADSSQAGAPESQVVGYLAAAIRLAQPEPGFSLTEEEKTELLRLARSSLELFILENRVLNCQPRHENLAARRGAFVTLKKGKVLRGCIGFIEPAQPLYQAVIQAAVYAAIRDTRFPPLSPAELKDVEIEISVLSFLQKITDPKVIKVGKHGLVISKDNLSGLLLPQVAVENRWSRETFLQQACLKAGLHPNAWKDGAAIYIFEAVVFPK